MVGMLNMLKFNSKMRHTSVIFGSGFTVTNGPQVQLTESNKMAIVVFVMVVTVCWWQNQYVGDFFLHEGGR